MRTIAVTIALGLAWTANGTEPLAEAQRAVQEAQRARNGGDAQRALRILESALAECGTEKGCQAMLLVALGGHAEATGDPRTALARYEKALPMWHEIGNMSGEAMTLNNIGYIYNDLGRKQKALDFFERALPMWHELGDRSGEARMLNNIGSVYWALGLKQRALEYLERALPILREVGDQSGEAGTLSNISSMYDGLGQKQKAVEYYERALPILREVGDRNGEAATLNNIGRVYDSLGQKQKAVEYYERALPILHEVGDRTSEATTLGNIGYIYNDLGQKQKALEYYERALPILREVGDQSGEARALNNIGSVYDDLGEKQKALEYCERALPILHELGDRSGEAATLNNIGGVYSDLGQKQKALDYYEKALQMRRELGDRSGEAQTLNNIGAVYSATGEKQKALEYYERVLPMSREVGDRRVEAATLNNIGNVHSVLGQKQRALDYYEEALQIQRELGDRSGEAQTLNHIGLIYDDLSEKRKALESYESARSIHQEVGNKSGEAATLNNIGGVYSDLGQKQKALEYYGRALLIIREAGNRRGEATTLNNIGSVYVNVGQSQRALEYYERALPMSRELGDRRGEAMTTANIGFIYNELGRPQRALEYYKRALPIWREAGDRSGEASTLTSIGTVYQALGQGQKAAEHYMDALLIEREIGDRSGETATLNNIGGLYSAHGEKQKALEYYKRTLPMCREVGDRSGEARALNNIGRAYSALGRPQKALECYERALPMLHEVENRRGEAGTLHNIALVVKPVSPERAVLHAKQAVNIMQSLRRDVGQDKKLQRSFANSISDTYRFLAQLLARQGRVAEAQQAMDLLKGDEMGRLLQRSTPPGGRILLSTREAALDETYSKLAERMAPLQTEAGALRLKKALSAEEQRQLAALEQKIAKTEAELTAFFDEIPKELARPDAERAGQDEARVAQGLPPGTVAVYTIAGDESVTIILYTQRDHAVGEAQMSFADLGKAVSSLRKALSTRQGNVEAAGAKLYELLVAPIADKLEEAKAQTIIWSLDGPLRYVPVAALRDPKQKKWLMEEYRNVVISTAKHTGPTSPPEEWSALGLGVTKGDGRLLPPLKGVETELAAVVRDANSPEGAIRGLRLLDGEFTRAAMEKELKEHRPVLHIATHYVFAPPGDNAMANGSYLLLGDGSHLTLKDLDGMGDETFRGVDLLTLSACETAVGAEDLPELEGAEVDGLAYVARQKGADAVLATLWRVNDASTSTFMAELYRRRVEGKMSKAEALQETQLAFLRGEVPAQSGGNIALSTGSTDRVEAPRPVSGNCARGTTPCAALAHPDWSHPYYWAPFILIGNWM